MRLIQHSTIATLMLAVAGLLLTASFGWPVEAGLRVLAFLGSGVWVYALIAQIFLMQAHTQGEIDRSMNEWHMTLPLPVRGVGRAERSPNQLIDAEPQVERLLPVHTSTPQSQITPVVVSTPTAQRMIELPSGVKLPREDLKYFVEHLDERGHMRKDWVGVKLPSGKVVDSVAMQPLIAAVRTTGEFPKWGQGVKAKRTLSTAEIKQRLHLD